MYVWINEIFIFKIVNKINIIIGKILIIKKIFDIIKIV